VRERALDHLHREPVAAVPTRQRALRDALPHPGRQEAPTQAPQGWRSRRGQKRYSSSLGPPGGGMKTCSGGGVIWRAADRIAMRGRLRSEGDGWQHRAREPAAGHAGLGARARVWVPAVAVAVPGQLDLGRRPRLARWRPRRARKGLGRRGGGDGVAPRRPAGWVPRAIAVQPGPHSVAIEVLNDAGIRVGGASSGSRRRGARRRCWMRRCRCSPRRHQGRRQTGCRCDRRAAELGSARRADGVAGCGGADRGAGPRLDGGAIGVRHVRATCRCLDEWTAIAPAPAPSRSPRRRRAAATAAASPSSFEAKVGRSSTPLQVAPGEGTSSTGAVRRSSSKGRRRGFALGQPHPRTSRAVPGGPRRQGIQPGRG